MISSKKIDIHADDYAITINTSKDLLDCMKHGCLDSISIICNTSYFDSCMNMLYEEIPMLPFLPMMSVHINLVEGKSVSDNLLILSENNLLSLSWAKIFFMSFGFKRQQLKQDLKKEIKAQLEKTWNVIKKCMKIAKDNNIPFQQKSLRIDSHQHIHSIPLLWESLIEVIEENGYEIEYIRNPKEPIMPFLRHFDLYGTYRPVNFIKNRLLMFFSRTNDNYCEIHHLEKMYMWGLIMSGKMDIDRIKKIYNDMLKKAKNDNRRLEILFHPGLALNKEDNNELAKDSMNDFYLSDNRHIEKDAVMKIKNEIC